MLLVSLSSEPDEAGFCFFRVLRITLQYCKIAKDKGPELKLSAPNKELNIDNEIKQNIPFQDIIDPGFMATLPSSPGKYNNISP